MTLSGRPRKRRFLPCLVLVPYPTARPSLAPLHLRGLERLVKTWHVCAAPLLLARAGDCSGEPTVGSLLSAGGSVLGHVSEQRKSNVGSALRGRSCTSVAR